MTDLIEKLKKHLDEALGIEISILPWKEPLGHGIATSVGMAIAERMLAAHFPGIVDHRTYVLASDGDLMEGVSQEAIAIAGHLRLSKLIVFSTTTAFRSTARPRSPIRSTRSPVSNPPAGTPATSTGSIPKRSATPFTPRKLRQADDDRLQDDHRLRRAHKAGTNKAHGEALGAEEVAGARKNLNWPYEPFVVPEDILAAWRTVGARGAPKRPLEGWADH